MPDFTAWPIEDDLTARLTALGVTLPAGLDADEVIAEAVSEWDRATKWSPFLAEESDSETVFDYFGGRLDFRGGYTEVTEVAANIDSGNPSGTVLTEGTDYRLYPSHAPNVNRPYTDIVFVTSVLKGVGTVKVTGKRGYCTTIDRDAWYAVLDRAVKTVLEFRAGEKGQVVEFQQDTVRKKFASATGGGTIDAFDQRWKKAVGRYKRVFC